MRWKLVFVPVLALFSISAAIPARSQVAHSAYEGRIPLTIGGGVSDYLLDWGHSRKMIGITAWADWRLRSLPSYFSGLGIQIEGHHIAYDRPASLDKMQQDSGLGGLTYQWRRYDRIHPYAKAMAGFGSIDFGDTVNPLYTHDTRTIMAFGGGADIHAWRGVSVRADYEYQFWHQLFGPHDLTPSGVTVGAVYDFGRRH